MSKTWRDLKALVPEAPDDVCRSALGYASFEQALAFLQESFQTVHEEKKENEQDYSALVDQLCDNFPTIDEDIAILILEDANFDLDAAIEDCKRMEKKFNRYITSYVPQELIEYVDSNQNPESQITEENKIDPQKLFESQKWDPFTPVTSEPTEIPKISSNKLKETQQQSNWNPFFGQPEVSLPQDPKAKIDSELLSQTQEQAKKSEVQPQSNEISAEKIIETQKQNEIDSAAPATDPYKAYEDLIDFNAPIKSMTPSNTKSPEEINNLIQEIQLICPNKTTLEIREALKSVNYSAQRAANKLLGEDKKTQNTPKQPQKLTKREKRYNERVQNLPEAYRLNRSENSLREENIKKLLEIFEGADPEFLTSILDRSNNDINGAIATLSQMNHIPSLDDGDYASRLRSLFVSATDYEVSEALKMSNNDVNLAVEYLLTRRFDAPPPEDAILAVRPDVSLARARKALRDNRGDVKAALASLGQVKLIRLQREKPWEKREIAKRTLTIDLHGYKAEEAIDFVGRAIRNSRNSVGTIYFVTGRGLHSKEKRSVLRPLVMRMCRKAGAETFVQKGNTGVVVCRFARFV